ncbi:MAG: DNA/RNA nuclease SfsA [Lachnospiraceae bacterium]|nr:DNA/RNA nuclease SfsA [Lachnospiraceae bacterium]
MKYNKIVKGTFIERPNRFIAYVEIDGTIEKCHVKNTGRCKELLIKGVTVYLEEGDNPNRKTKYSLVAVEKGNILINIDSQAPNKVVGEWLNSYKEQYNITHIKPEKTYKESRIDYYFETEVTKAYMEVKGVTLLDGKIARFPDAPTIRGIKHIEHLVDLVEQGYDAYIMFVVQCKGVISFEPNDITHKEFGDALRIAAKKGVKILVYDCVVTEDSMRMDKLIQQGIF